MNATEIRYQVRLGSHNAVQAFLAPAIAQLTAALSAVEPKASVRYDGAGGVLVQLEAEDCASTAQCWERIWRAARAVRAGLPEATWRVSRPHRGSVDGGCFAIVRDSFRVAVR